MPVQRLRRSVSVRPRRFSSYLWAMREGDFPVDDADEILQGLFEKAVPVYRREKSAGGPCRAQSDVSVDPDGHSTVIPPKRFTLRTDSLPMSDENVRM